MMEDILRTLIKLAVKQARQITDDNEALEVKILFKEYDKQIGKEIKAGEYIQNGDKLYKVTQDHIVQTVYGLENKEYFEFVGTEPIEIENPDNNNGPNNPAEPTEPTDKNPTDTDNPGEENPPTKENNEGTLENPIIVSDATKGIAYVEGKYYKEENSIYKCNTSQTLNYSPSEMLGVYFELITTVTDGEDPTISIEQVSQDIITEEEMEATELVKGNYFNTQSFVDLLWNQNYKGQGMKIGIVDTGLMSTTHPMIENKIETGMNFCKDSTEQEDITSTHFHGLAVASLIVGEYINELTYGIAPEAKIVIAKCLDDNGKGYNSSVSNAINYCVRQGCDVINCSLGGGMFTTDLRDALRNAVANHIPVVVSSGNESKGEVIYSYPAAIDDAIAVGAINSDFELANFSNFNNYIDLVAPGVSIKVAYGDNKYAYCNGTSFAAPLVSGFLALLKQKFVAEYNRQPSEGELYGMLCYYCRRINGMDDYKQGHGYIDCSNLRIK